MHIALNEAMIWPILLRILVGISAVLLFVLYILAAIEPLIEVPIIQNLPVRYILYATFGVIAFWVIWLVVVLVRDIYKRHH